MLDFSGVALSTADLQDLFLEGVEGRVLVPLDDVLGRRPSDASVLLLCLCSFVVAGGFLDGALSSSSDEKSQVNEPLLLSDAVAFILEAATEGRFLCDSGYLVFLLVAVLFVTIPVSIASSSTPEWNATFSL